MIDALKRRGLWHDGTAKESRVMSALAQHKAQAAPEMTDKERENLAFCRRAWDAAVSAENTLAQLYLQCRGIVSADTPLPPSLRFLEAKTALLAAVTLPDIDEIVGLHVVFLEEDETGVSKTNRLSFGPVRLGHIKLSAPDTRMQITESLEDGLALMQMNGAATLAVPGTSFLASHVVPPRECKTVILAPDNDAAGRGAIEKATLRLHKLGFNVNVLLPPPDSDWCDVIYETEERTAIREEPNG